RPDLARDAVPTLQLRPRMPLLHEQNRQVLLAQHARLQPFERRAVLLQPRCIASLGEGDRDNCAQRSAANARLALTVLDSPAEVTPLALPVWDEEASTRQ